MTHRRQALAKQILQGPIRERVRQKVQELIHRPGFSPSDAPDIEQDLLIRLIGALSKYDPRRGTLETFARSVIRHAGVDIVRRRQAARRAHRREQCSLHDKTGDDDSQDELHECLDHDARRPATQLSEEEATSLRLDLHKLLSESPEDQRLLAEHLGRDCLAQVARLIGRPRTTIGDQVRRIRKRFEDGGLRDYL